MKSIAYTIGLALTVPLFALGLAACNDDPDNSTPDREYELVWSDEFNGEAGSKVDSTKWTYDIGKGSNGWGNAELQSYTDDPDNVSMDGQGNLVITAIKVSEGVTPRLGSRLRDCLLISMARIEARIKTPAGQGMWPAFWMLGEDINTVGWPRCGEIDIMEQKGQYPFLTYGSLHGPGYSAGQAITNSYRLDTERFDDDFYIYAVEWGEDYIDFFLDDNLYASVPQEWVPGDWVYDHPFFIILNVAVGGTFVGSPNSNTPFPGSMYVDYVRVYKEK